MRLGIAGSIGGLKPVALVGLFKAMEDVGLYDEIVAFSAASGSAPWCALAAQGWSPSEMWDIAGSIRDKSVYEDPHMLGLVSAAIRSLRRRELLPGWTGIMRGDRLRDWLYDHLGTVDFEDLPKPLYLTAFDINEARGCLFGPGMTAARVQVAKAVRASTAIPWGFRHEDIVISPGERAHGFWDGGVVSSLPIWPLIEFENVDTAIVLDAAAVTEPAGREWISIDSMDVLDMAEAMLDGHVAAANEMEVRYAKEHVRLIVLKVRVPALMSNPGGTIGRALFEGYLDAKELLSREFGVE